MIIFDGIFPTPYSLLPTPYSLLPVPCSLFPAPCSLSYSFTSQLKTL
ncbi:hypothetical protein [Moorena sp. SIO4G3]|nr:hypothetical protein [Moorena sp. SIO4G3]NEO79818.1 hypothetical protein [Moorena sp. SIO4G3]